MFTNEELFEYFSDRYSEEQITNALEKLGIDPKTDVFPASITERIESVFQVVEDAIASTKQLSGDMITVQQTAINLSIDRALDIPVNVIHGMIEILDAEATVEAYALHERRKAVREGVLTQLELGSLAAANEEAAKRMDALQQLCKDPEALDQILLDYGLLTHNDAVKQRLELTDSCSLDFDVDAFLNEVNPEKKPQPKTINDTKNLAKKLITRSLK